MAERPSLLRRWLMIIGLLAIVVGVPLIFREEFVAISDRVLAAADERPFAAAALIVAALTLDVFLPVPNGVTNTLAGAAFGFALGTFVIWLGLMGGSTAGYALGRWGARPLAARLLGADDLEHAHRIAERAGPVALIVSRPVPILCEMTPIAAGIAGMAFGHFLFAVALGNLGVGVVYAAIGAAAVERTSTELLMLGAIGVPLAAWLGWQAIERWRAR
ncbi:MAG: VTT domain-containing protein [Sphingopyxis sp.]|uniref:TVP38/TMEM64 family protein n=1 Tax=Sphingopyxis sp. TaxID=1908224 RepID=UPI001A4E0E21|nr:VTT domain-containing protein [Sphingopyxis sp.]MBL9066658.1 VTT domain-containing protein [Sphingopyxis sp.]